MHFDIDARCNPLEDLASTRAYEILRSLQDRFNKRESSGNILVVGIQKSDDVSACQSNSLVQSIIHATVPFTEDFKVGVLCEQFQRAVRRPSIYDPVLKIGKLLFKDTSNCILDEILPVQTGSDYRDFHYIYARPFLKDSFHARTKPPPQPLGFAEM
jgi:hypothetical protein